MAQPQGYSNHIRFYPPHHYVFYPVMMAAIAFCSWRAYNSQGENRLLWLAVEAGFVCLTWLGWMLRQHYALTLQDRIVLLELRYRYFATTGQRFEPLEEKLTAAQLFALRFVPDEDFAALAQKAIAENLSGDAIKKSITNWKADLRRV
jgi:hypothetical protein